jgi:uncharacterized protein (TIGR02118 family)
VPKFMALLDPPSSLAAPDFVAVLRERCEAVITKQAVSRLVLDTVDVPPEEAGLRPGGKPAYAAVLEFWTEKDATAIEVAAVTAGDASIELYRVTEVVEKAGERESHLVSPTVGIKSIYLARRRADLTHDQMIEHWGSIHAPLAIKHHIGMWRYARNVVEAALLPVAEPWDGFAELYFRTSEDLIQRMFDSAEGRSVIAADVARFSGPGKALHTREHVLLA